MPRAQLSKISTAPIIAEPRKSARGRPSVKLRSLWMKQAITIV